jgi:hypothetical protein
MDITADRGSPHQAAVDRLAAARNILVAALVVCLAGMGLVVLDVVLRGHGQHIPSAGLQKQYDLPSLCFLPAGDPLRHPDFAHGAVMLRQAPWLPPPASVKALLLTPSGRLKPVRRP